ncbi:MAG TPA: ATP-binding cassette domain-containing protein [Mycobacteriales bacterium]|nr:ATP-binding cassette domain-containing protein [Mycobacteriales bacterium]
MPAPRPSPAPTTASTPAPLPEPAVVATSDPTQELAVVATNLVKTYPAGRHAPPVRALDGFTLTVAAGSVVALLGPNGAGKTTATKVLTTLATADSGEAQVAGIDVRRHPDQVRARIGLVAQRPTADPLATGRENLALAGRIQGLTRADAVRRAGELLDRFSLADAADRLARTYSGGMGRKLDVALGLMHRPQVLFLDEPTTGLDPQARAELWAEIAQLSAGERVTVVLTTHYLEEADRLADRVAIVEGGRIVVEGSPEQLKRELRGDTLQLDLDGTAAAGAAAAALATVPGLRDVRVDGGRLRARADDGARVLSAVVGCLDRAGLAAAAVTVARPTLDDVYLHHVGRSFEEVQAA